MRAVKAQLPVKANTDLSHRPALVAESLSLFVFTMAFLSSTVVMSLCRQNCFATMSTSEESSRDGSMVVVGGLCQKYVIK